MWTLWLSPRVCSLQLNQQAAAAEVSCSATGPSNKLASFFLVAWVQLWLLATGAAALSCIEHSPNFPIFLILIVFGMDSSVMF